jgi:hypothetical protein
MGGIKVILLFAFVLICVEKVKASLSVTSTIKSVYSSQVLDGNYPIVQGLDKPRPYMWPVDNSSFQVVCCKENREWEED